MTTPDNFDDIDLVDVEVEDYETRTHRLDLDNGRVDGEVDGIDAIVQAVRKIMLTERYSTPIYSGEYGVELETLIGKPMYYVQAELPRRIEEALLADERILAVEDMEVERGSQIDSMVVRFNVLTDEGEIAIEEDVIVL